MAPEIMGIVTRVGPKVTTLKVGDRAGVGAQVDSCRTCKQCTHDNETYCPNYQVDTYGSRWPNSDVVSQGGYGAAVRVPEHWVFPIPEKLDTNKAAPLLCAGITVFSPLVRNGAGPGKKVGVVGIGGLGHLAILFSKALGAETWAISRSRSKEADSKKLGADGYIATAEDGWERPHKFSFDLIICCANSSTNFDMNKYLSLMDVHGRWIGVGMPEEEGFEIKNQGLIANGVLMGSSHIGNRKETLQMLQLAAEKDIYPWVEEVPISKENLTTIVNRMKKGDVHYRFTLTDYGKQFG